GCSTSRTRARPTTPTRPPSTSPRARRCGRRPSPEPMEKQIDVHYCALFRDLRGPDRETSARRAGTPRALPEGLGLGGASRLDRRAVRVAVNGAGAAWYAPLRRGDPVVFIARPAGG